MTQTTLASLKGVRKRFGAIQALDGLDLSVNRGELLAVLGPNGAGKTTAIGMLLGLQSPDEGSAELFGVAPQEIDARRRIGVMMQEVQLAGVMRPRELLEQVASYYPVPYDLDSVVERLSLQKLMQRPYGRSGRCSSRWRCAVVLNSSFWMNPPRDWTSTRANRSGR